MRAGERVDQIGLSRRQLCRELTANSRSDTKVQGDRGELQRGFHRLAPSDQGRSVNTHPDIVVLLLGDCLLQLPMGEARPGDAMPVLLELGCRKMVAPDRPKRVGAKVRESLQNSSTEARILKRDKVRRSLLGEGPWRGPRVH